MVFNATFNKISVIFVEKTTDLPHVTDKLYHIPVNLWQLLGGNLPPTNSSKGEILCVAFKRTKLYLVVAYM